MNVLIYVGYQAIPFNPSTLETVGLGGTEIACIKLSKELKRFGHTVIVSGDVLPGTFGGIEWLPTEECHKKYYDKFDIIIAASYIHVTLEFKNYLRAKLIFWAHNTDFHPYWRGKKIKEPIKLLNGERVDRVVCLTEWHKNQWKESWGTKDIEVIGNGIDTSTFIGRPPKVKNSFIWSSAPERGLLELLKNWKHILHIKPDATLNIFSPSYSIDQLDNSSEIKELLDAGVHFGHLTRKWNPNMAPYIFMERNGIHVIDLHKTVAKLDEACNALKQIAASGKKVMFVATKKQAREAISSAAESMDMPFVTERWTGGMLTNFVTIRKAIRKMSQIEKVLNDPEATGVNKKERLLLKRQKEKLEKNLGSISELNRLPAALFIVDVKKEHIAVKEAKRLNIPTFAIVDTNSDPKLIDFPIPANDDAAKSIAKIMEIVSGAVNEGLSERKATKEKKVEAKPKSEEVAAETKEEAKA